MTVVNHLDTNTLLASLTPMLADTSPGELQTLVGTHLFDEKLDGVRAIAAMGPSGFTMRNRNGRDTTLTYPEISVAADLIPGPWIIDGEIVAVNGAFQDIARRDKQTSPTAVATAMATIPARFVAFDVLYDPDLGDVRHYPYSERRALLNGLGLSGDTITVSRASHNPELYDHIRSEGGEGVIAKRLTARYTPGRSPHWLKYKSKHSVTCIAIGYEPGKGARAAIGAVLLAMVGEDGAQSVGKVGSGFTAKTIAEMKTALDAGQLPLLEVECLGKTRNHLLRQPIFKGLRTDLNLLDATAAQLTALPTT